MVESYEGDTDQNRTFDIYKTRRYIMEVFITFLAGFSVGWGSAWIARTLPFLKDTAEEELDYNMIEKSVGEFVNSKYDPENYFSHGEGTK